MLKYYHFQADSPLSEVQLANLLSENYHGDLTIKMVSSNRGYCLAAADFADTLEVLLPLIVSDLGISITFLVCHANDHLSALALAKAALTHKEQCTHLGDLLLDSLLIGDRSLFPEAVKEFDDVPHEVLVTATVYAACGLNATMASRKLYIHRNTFNYRLAKFTAITNLDIRDFHNAQYFTIVSKLFSQK